MKQTQAVSIQTSRTSWHILLDQPCLPNHHQRQLLHRHVNTCPLEFIVESPSAEDTRRPLRATAPRTRPPRQPPPRSHLSTGVHHSSCRSWIITILTETLIFTSSILISTSNTVMEAHKVYSQCCHRTWPLTTTTWLSSPPAFTTCRSLRTMAASTTTPSGATACTGVTTSPKSTPSPWWVTVMPVLECQRPLPRVHPHLRPRGRTAKFLPP